LEIDSETRDILDALSDKLEAQEDDEMNEEPGAAAERGSSEEQGRSSRKSGSRDVIK
jgi:hypothetical protein